VLGQIKVDEKSNEITAIPQLLKALEISGCIITIDAMGCQTEIAKTIVEEQVELCAGTQRQPGQLESSQYQAYIYDYEKTVNKGHGRIEIRECWTISDPQILWPREFRHFTSHRPKFAQTRKNF
jgi:predicted transposase YbfD/YdcC